jgi:hypothetical protein
MRTKKEPETVIDLVREKARKILWDISYHEEGLIKCEKRLALTKAALARCSFNLDVDVDEAVRTYGEDEDGEQLKNGDDLLRNWIGEAYYLLRLHDKGLQEAHQRLGALKGILAHDGVDVSLSEVAAELREEG